MISLPAATQPDANASADWSAVVEAVIEAHPTSTLESIRRLATASPADLAFAADRLAAALAEDRRLDDEVDRIAGAAALAQEAFENWAEDRVDRLLLDLATAFAVAAENLAEATVLETGLGNVADKAVKNRFASIGTYNALAGRTAQGTLCVDGDRKVTDLASPAGVVFGIVPVTNPVCTAMFKTLISLKGRNALILSFHRNALGVGRLTADIIRGVLDEHGAPRHLVHLLDQRPSHRTTQKLMSHPKVSLILATGGAGLVKAAYSSGRPAIGVGPGNAPAWICADADLERAAHAIVVSKAFDNGLICGGENHLVVDERVVDPFIDALERHGAAILTAEERDRFGREAVDRAGAFRRDLVGRSASVIAAALGIARRVPPRLLIARTTAADLGGFYAQEKLAPFLSLFTVSGEDEGLRLSRHLLTHGGAGHTAVIHTINRARVERFARTMPAGRILVNSPAAQGCCGMTTGLACSMTLGCGTFGGNSTTDNVTYRHLLNVKRIAYHLDGSSAQSSAARAGGNAIEGF